MADIKRTDAIAGDIVHEYDGIEEADNELPTWWVVVFVASIGFGAVYWLVFQEFHLEPTPSEALAIAQAERSQNTGQWTDADLMAASQNPKLVESGKKAFTTNCVVCHGPNAQGNIGPNLTDTQWIHGGSPSQIFGTIRDGVPAKGMPSWASVLGLPVVKDLAAYVLTIRDTNVPGKAPEGEVWKAP
jgi:cytochrome c oxidase cbb3-type subunit 3